MGRALGRVLVVDDHRDIREGIGEYLRVRGWEVRTAASVAEARDALAGVDLVVVDLRLGDEDGMTIVEALSGGTVGVVVVTAFGSVETAVRAMRAGAVDYLLKPARLERVHRALLQAAEVVAERRRRARRERLVRLVEAAHGVAPAPHPEALAAEAAELAMEETRAAGAEARIEGDAVVTAIRGRTGSGARLEQPLRVGGCRVGLLAVDRPAAADASARLEMVAGLVSAALARGGVR